eukprot:gene35383-45836_t
MQTFQIEEGTLVTWTSQHNDIMIWTHQSLKPLKILKGHTLRLMCALPLHDGRIVSGSVDSLLKIWDSSTGKCVADLVGHRD